MAKRKCACVFVDMKLQALDEVEKKIKPKAEIAKGYGVPASTLSTWIKIVNLSDKVRESQMQRASAAGQQNTQIKCSISVMVYVCIPNWAKRDQLHY